MGVQLEGQSASVSFRINVDSGFHVCMTVSAVSCTVMSDLLHIKLPVPT